jgi:hypothetical protein
MATEETGRDDDLRNENESLKARVAELEDKLSRCTFTEEEYKTYRKVAEILCQKAVSSQCEPENKREDAGGARKGRGPSGPRPRYVLMPIVGIPFCAVVGPAIFGRGFEDLGR